jgi:hypothetical protein
MKPKSLAKPKPVKQASPARKTKKKPQSAKSRKTLSTKTGKDPLSRKPGKEPPSAAAGKEETSAGTPSAKPPSAPSYDSKLPDFLVAMANAGSSFEELAFVLQVPVDVVKSVYGARIRRERMAGRIRVKSALYFKAVKGEPAALRLWMEREGRRPQRYIQLLQEKTKLQTARVALRVAERTEADLVRLAQMKAKMAELQCKQKEDQADELP